MTHTAPLYFWRYAAPIAALTLTLTMPVAAQDAAQPDRIDQGVVEIDIEYEDVGPMGAMLPKSERVLFRPGQVRVESGMNITLHGVVPGRTVQLMELQGHKLAFLIPISKGDPSDSPIRYEPMPERRVIAGLPAHQIDGVDREDETNRMAFWLTDRLAAKYPVEGNLPDGFALDHVLLINDGTAHKVAKTASAAELDDALFAIPEDYRQIEVDSGRDIGTHLGEILGGDIEVVE